MTCYVSVTMSTQSPSPNIIIIITPIPRRYSCLSSLSSPSDYSDISVNPRATPRSRLLRVHIKLRAHYHTPSSSLAYLMSMVFGNLRRIVENNVVGLKNKALLVGYDNWQELVRVGIKYELVQSDEGHPQRIQTI